MRPSQVTIDRVGRVGRTDTIRFLIAGGDGPQAPRAGVASVSRLLECGGGRGMLWQVRCGGRRVAAALVSSSPGRVGMLLHSPAAAPAVEAHALTTLVRDISVAALKQDLAFVQRTIPPALGADQATVEAAGFHRLAQLIYLRKDLVGSPLPDVPARDGQNGLTWCSYETFAPGELAGILPATYEGSLDCPGLAGLRDIDDVITGHKNGERFCPPCWWIVRCDGRPCGCILVNDWPSQCSAEVVYMGVAPEFRGRGLGRIMLDSATWAARQRQRLCVDLAVDSRNIYAQNVYRSAGFREVSCRDVYILASHPACNMPARERL